MLCDYCAERGIGNNRCGNLIVATSPSQFEQLQSIIIRAAANGVRDLRLLTRAKAQGMEPQLECVAAIHSPSTGIVDRHALTLSLQGDIENAGRCIVLNPAIDQLIRVQSAIEVLAIDGTRLAANSVINGAGLNAPLVASRLIYPVPEAAGLGVHLTIDLGGQARFGPDVEWVNSPDDLAVEVACSDAFYAEVRKRWLGA